MSADFTGGGADAIAFDLATDGWGPGKSVFAYLEGRSHIADPAGNEWIWEIAVEVHAGGPVVFPFASYPPEQDFSDVDEMTLTVDSTGGMNLSLGPLHSVALSTPAANTTWGRLKAGYR